MPSAVESIQSAREYELDMRLELEKARQELRDSLEAGREAGMTLQELADLVGLTRQRVHELLKEER